jgi:protein MAK16
MQIDDVVWQVINQGHCSFKIKTISQNFCRNEYNVTGLCTRSSCPLANGNYATVIEKEGVCMLYIKTIERGHMPNKQWEVIRLDKSYAKALEQIDEQLQYWPKFLIHKCKQRLTKLRQMINRIRRLKLKGLSEITTIKKKTERREKVRETKAEIAANIETSIEQELLDRLKEGTYGDIYNYNPKVFEKIMEDQEVEEEGEEEDDEEMDESAFIFDPNEVGDSDEESEVELNMAKDSFEDFEDTFKPTKIGKAGKDKKKIPKTFGERVQKKVKPSPAVEIEYENEFEKATEDA